MSQQINLLAEKKAVVGSTHIVLAALALLLLALVAVWAVRQRDVAAAQAAEAASARQLRDAQARLQAVRPQPGSDLRAEIAALLPQADAAQKMLAQTDDLGGRQGYARYFSVLAGIAEDGLWLTSIAVDKAGKSVHIAGRALHEESVMRYTQRLNAAFADDGVQFTALELSPVTATKAGEPGVQLTAVAFKLN